MWSVVVFEKDNSVEAVPSCWYMNGRCFWPKNSKHCKKLLERRSIPNSIEYDLFTARPLSLNINSLTTARQKASKGQIYSDVSSADDDIQTRKERKKKLSPSLSPELPKKKPSHTITSPPLWDSSDSNGEIVNSQLIHDIQTRKEHKKKLSPSLSTELQKKKPSAHTITSPPLCDLSDSNGEKVNCQLINENKSQTQSNFNITTPITKKPMLNRNLFDCFSEPANTKKKIALNSDDDAVDITDIDYTNCKDIFEDQHDYGSSSIYISSNSEPPQKLASFSQSNGSKVEKKSTSYKNSINNISATPSTSNINNTIERDDSNSYNYAKQTLRIATNLKYDIKRLHDGQDYLKMMVDKIFSQLNNQTSSSSDSHSLHHYDVPHITNENDLNEWEDTIKDSSYLSTIAQQLSLMGGQSISETVRKLMQRLFSDTFLVDYSFIGFKGKKTFSNLRSCDLIKLAVRKVPLFQNASDNEIEKPLKSFMAQASARLKLKTKVIPSTNSQNTDSEKDL